MGSNLVFIWNKSDILSSTYDSVSFCNLFNPGQGRKSVLVLVGPRLSPLPPSSGVHSTQWRWSLRGFLNQQVPAPEPMYLLPSWLEHPLVPALISSGAPSDVTSREALPHDQINNLPSTAQPPSPALLFSIAVGTLCMYFFMCSLPVSLYLNGSSLGQGLCFTPCCIFRVCISA